MKKNLIPVAAVAAFLTMGLSMPSCPGQAEMEQKITELTQRLDKADKTMAGTLKVVTELKGAWDAFAPSKDAVKADLDKAKEQIAALEAKVAELTAKMEAAGGKKKKK
jgi:hypothetical protein